MDSSPDSHSNRTVTAGHDETESAPTMKEVRKSSLVLRKRRPLDVDLLLSLNKKQPEITSNTLIGDDMIDSSSSIGTGIKRSIMHNPQQQQQHKTALLLRCLQKICLNPKWSLQKQLILSFGTISALTILFVVVICIVVARYAGANVKDINQQSLEELFGGIQTTSARYLAESLAIQLIPEDVVNILYEMTRDRFAGYPDPSDANVPFYDMESKTNKYPIRGQPLPLDWQMKNRNVLLVNEQNYQEHVQDRWWTLYAHGPPLAANAFYFMRGSCNPNEEKLVNSSTLNLTMSRPTCTDAYNNNITAGGIDAPSLTNEMIHRKASDLGPIMKSLFEYHQEIKYFGIYFSNSGAGSYVGYPQYSPSTNMSYFSIGCNWMSMPNPLDQSKPIGTQKEIDHCQPDGTSVPPRSYNVLERGWCRDQAIQPNRIVVNGPYLDAWTANLPLITVGRSIYDRVTKQFIGCIGVDMVLSSVQQAVNLSAISSYMEVSVVRWDSTGTLLATSLGNGTLSAGDKIVTIENIDVGVPRQRYDEVLSLIDYNKVWDPKAVNQRYESYRINGDLFQVSSYPIPPVPDSYDANYQPDFLVFLSVYRNAIDDRVQNVNNVVETHERQALLIAVVLGCAGMVLVLLIVAATSNMITLPLGNMNRAATQIMGSFGTSSNDENKIEVVSIRQTSIFSRCTPKTELNQIVEEFEKLVTSFSGSSMAKSTRMKLSDSRNQFHLQYAFHDLYQSRNIITHSKDHPTNDTGFIHLGSNVTSNPPTTTTCEEFITLHSPEVKARLGSRLFLWITILIVTPLLVTTVCISTIVLYRINNEFRSAINYAGKYYVDVELSALTYYARSRADKVSSATAKSIRDLHIMTRYSSWLFFDGLARTEAFIDVMSGEDACKNATNVTDCNGYEENNVCDCGWNDAWGIGDCKTYDVDSRYLQKLEWGCQSLDTWPNGNRNSTSFPNHSFSPETTEWWHDVNALPGWEKGSRATGYATTYDRLRVASSIPVFQVLYNYEKLKRLLTAWVTFEADGLLVGYSSCTTALVSYWWNARWKSSSSNGAFQLRPELCPLGKYGYDPRCRGWYNTGKELAEQALGAVYVTPPFLDSGGAIVALAATAPIYDPSTNVSLGQILYEFLADSIYVTLENRTTLSRGGFPILITAQSDFAGADTVIGPGFSRNESAQPITKLVLPSDHSCTTDRCSGHISHFGSVHTAMRTGVANSSSFQRTKRDGSVETLYIAYAPVIATSYRPLNSSDYSRGVVPSQFQIYSLALVETKDGLLASFAHVQRQIEDRVVVATIILSVVIFAAILFVVYVSYLICISLTDMMIYILRVIRSINRMDIHQEHPKIGRSLEVQYGSQELTLLTDAIETLYKLIQSVNASYFAGDLEKSYFVLHDALHLFRRLDNKKAIGVACNNLGNVILAIYRRMNRDGTTHCGIDALGNPKAIIEKGIRFYTEAIQLGEIAYEQFYEQQGWTPNCLDFMQHLSNRYFNRAMFLLTVKDDHIQPEEIKQLGLRDIQISHDMDSEIVTYGEEVGWGSTTRIQKLLDVAIVRACGHIILLEMGYTDEWDMDESLQNAHTLLQNEMKQQQKAMNAMSNDFCCWGDMNLIGRLQQLEAVMMRYQLDKGQLHAAAKIAIRCLVEDEYILPDTHNQAVYVLLCYVKSYLLLNNNEPKQDNDSNVQQQKQQQQQQQQQDPITATNLLKELDDYILNDVHILVHSDEEYDHHQRKQQQHQQQHQLQPPNELNAIRLATSVPSRIGAIEHNLRSSSLFSPIYAGERIGADITMEVF